MQITLSGLFFFSIFIGTIVYSLATRTKRKAEKAYRQKREKEELNESFRRGVMNSDLMRQAREATKEMFDRFDRN